MPHCFPCPKARIQAPWCSWRAAPVTSRAVLPPRFLQLRLTPLLPSGVPGSSLPLGASTCCYCCQEASSPIHLMTPTRAMQDALLKARSSGTLPGCSHSALYSPHHRAYTGKGRNRQPSVYMSVSPARWKAPAGQGLITRSLVPSL